MIKCIIADVNAAAIRAVKNIVDKLPQFTVEATFTDANLLMQHLRTNSADILLVNIEQPELNGYAFLQYLKNIPEIIVTAQKNNFAAEGYEHDIVAYVCKPIVPAKLLNALHKAARKIETRQRQIHPFLFIRAEYKLIKINIEDILFIEGLKNYSIIHTATSGKAIITLQNLKSFEEKLPPTDFIRIHRSFIVSFNKIDTIRKNSVLIGKNEIPISEGFKSQLHDIVSDYL